MCLGLLALQGELAEDIAAVTALVGAVTALVIAFTKLWRRDNYTDDRVDLLWKAHLARGVVEGLAKNLLVKLPGDTEESGLQPVPGKEITMPLAISKQAAEAFKPLEPCLKTLWKEVDGNEVRFAELLETRHPGWLQKFICIPLGVHEYACLAMAKLVACGAPQVEPLVKAGT